MRTDEASASSLDSHSDKTFSENLSEAVWLKFCEGRPWKKFLGSNLTGDASNGLIICYVLGGQYVRNCPNRWKTI